MVSLAKATKGSTQAIDYIMNDKGQAVELDRNYVVGEDGKDILAEFREVQSLNTRCENNTYTIVLSPDATQVKFSNEELLQLTRDHLKNLGLEKHQYIAYVHNSTKEQHVHIIANRISLEGTAHSDSMIHKKAHESAEKLAKDRGLYTAKEISQMKREMTADLRKEIRQAYEQCSSKSVSMENFKDLMHNKGYNVELSINKQGNVQGFRIVDRQTKQSFKASEIGKNVRLKDLSEKINGNLKTIDKAKEILSNPKLASRLPKDIVPPTGIVPLDMAVKIVKVGLDIVKSVVKSHGMGY